MDILSIISVLVKIKYKINRWHIASLAICILVTDILVNPSFLKSSIYIYITIFLIGCFYVAFSWHYNTPARKEIEFISEKEQLHQNYYEENTINEQFSFSTTIERLVFADGYWRLPTTNKNDDLLSTIIRFRGINLPAKTPNGPLHNSKNPTDFYESKRNVSFIDRPFPLREANQHFSRLACYGMNLVRLTVTWEAVMHVGPGIIDYEYLSYLNKLVDIAAKYGIYVIIDPHQDVWSRFTGGDGAPWWTLDAVGFNTDSPVLHETGCAFVDAFSNIEVDTNNNTSGQQKKKLATPPMMWPTNLGRLATATMFTLFFAGDVFAPSAKITDKQIQILRQESKGKQQKHPTHDDEEEEQKNSSISIQQFLQNNYFQFLDVVAKTLKDKPNVLGFNTMNEPSSGFIGLQNLRNTSFPCPIGHIISSFEGMCLSSGLSLDKPFYESVFWLHDTKIKLNPDSKSCWKSNDMDVWRNEGVYDIDSRTGERILKRPHHFCFIENRKEILDRIHNKMKKNSSSSSSSNSTVKDETEEINFLETFLVPFFQKVQETVCKHSKNFLIYAEPHIDPLSPKMENIPSFLDPNIFAWAPHYYDLITLVSKKHYSSWWFNRWINKITMRALNDIRHAGGVRNSNNDRKYHIMVGEIGSPFDLQTNLLSKDDTNNMAIPTMALDRVFRPLEEVDLDYTMWCYTHDNVIDDHWNGENLSIRSNGNNRGLLAVIRPHIIQHDSRFRVFQQKFDYRKLWYQLDLSLVKTDDSNKEINIIDNSEESIVEQKIYVPSYHFSNPKFSVSSGGKKMNILSLSTCRFFNHYL